jgi:hypothetical protein
MSEPLPNDAPNSAKKRLAEACRTKDTSLRVAWAVTIGEAILLGVAAVALADYWLMLPVWMRSLAAAVIAVLALAGSYRLIRFYCRPTPLKEAALDLEAAQPELGCEVSTAAEYLSGERQITHQYEPELVAALESKAAEDLRQAHLPYERRLLRPAIILGLTLLVLLVLLLAAPLAPTSLRRVIFPFSKVRYTQVEVRPGSMEIPVGRDVEITNRFTGRAPRDPTVHWEEQGAWQSAPLVTRTSDGSYLHSFRNLRHDLKYRVTGSDAVSDTYEIRTYVPPEVKDLSVQIQYPAYTRLQPTTQPSPDISAVRASTVQLQIEPSVQLSQARLRFSALTQAVVLQPTDQGAWTARFQVTQDTDYWIELADTQGHGGGDDQPHHIRALPDNPPTVEIREPGRSITAPATNRLPVTVSVADDFGVGAIEVAYHKLGGPEQVVPATIARTENGETIARAELDLPGLGLQEYELVTYRAQAKDNNTLDGPGIGKSPVQFAEITNQQATNSLPPQGQAQPLNLLAMQKQLVADTAALPADTSPERLQQLAARQRDAADLGNIYLRTLQATRAPADAITEMDSAVKDMASAGGRLAERRPGEALLPEESALAHLYQVLKHMPELGQLPTVPQTPRQLQGTNTLAVVLKAIQQQTTGPDTQNLQGALQQAQALARAQAQLNEALREANQALANGQGPGQAKGEGDRQIAKAGQNNTPADNPSNEGQDAAQGQGKGSGQVESAESRLAQADGAKGQGENPAQEMAAPPAPSDPGQWAGNEEELSKQAADLARQLQRLAAKDKHVGNHAGQNAKLAGEKMATASQDMKQGRFGAAGVNGFEGELALRQVVAQLERVLKERPELTDASSEEAPKEYDTLISEYFKKLSHAE